jgi:ataxin-3
LNRGGKYYNINGHPVYHEKQHSHCCGRHVINGTFQGPIFTDNQLMKLGRTLHGKEESLLLQPLMENPYFDDLGNYSQQVIAEALRKYDIRLLRLAKNQSAIQNARAFVINFNNHWITLRKFGNDWIDLDSLLSKPKLLTGFNIYSYMKSKNCRVTAFIVDGNLPEVHSQHQELENNTENSPVIIGNKPISSKGKGLKNRCSESGVKNPVRTQVRY